MLAIALLAPGALFWWGFDLPFPPIAGFFQALLIFLARGWLA